MGRIITRSAGILGVPITDEGALELARCARGTPRIANRLLKRARDFAMVESEGTPKHTNFINRIIEGYEYLGVMTSVDASGRCMLRCTPSTRPLALEVLSSLSDYVTIEG